MNDLKVTRSKVFKILSNPIFLRGKFHFFYVFLCKRILYLEVYIIYMYLFIIIPMFFMGVW